MPRLSKLHRKAGPAPDRLPRATHRRRASTTVGGAAHLAQDVHVLPDFLGNRSPYADPHARAVIAGLDLENGLDSLERTFVAGLCGLAYGLADVVDVMRSHHIPCRMMVISGGASRSALVRQIMADTTGVPVALPSTAEPVLLGAAMLGAVAGRAFPTLHAAIKSMSRLGPLTRPSTVAMADFHTAKRKVHGLLREVDRESRLIMSSPQAFPRYREEGRLERHAVELWRRADRFPADQGCRRSGCARAGGRRILSQHRRRHGPVGCTGRIRRRHIERSVRPHDRRSRHRVRRRSRPDDTQYLDPRRSPSSAPSTARRSTPSMTSRPRPGNGTIGWALFGSPRSKALHVGSTTLVRALRMPTKPWR